MNKKPIFIAEVKEKSPFGYKSDRSFHALMEIAITHGDWISVHVNPLWGGSFEAIEYVRKFTYKPILAKHVRPDDYQKALDYGASYLLAVDDTKNWAKFHPKVLLEISSLAQLNQLNDDKLNHGKIVYNGRDLVNGSQKNYFDIKEYTKFRKKAKWLCGASYIKNRNGVDVLYPDCDAFIVGQNLTTYVDNL